MKKIILVGALILILGTTILVVSASRSDDLPYTHSYTKAICNTDNLCRDYEIICKENKMVKMSPITGAVVQFSPEWVDSRNAEKINISCE